MLSYLIFIYTWLNSFMLGDQNYSLFALFVVQGILVLLYLKNRDWSHHCFVIQIICPPLILVNFVGAANFILPEFSIELGILDFFDHFSG